MNNTNLRLQLKSVNQNFPEKSTNDGLSDHQVQLPETEHGAKAVYPNILNTDENELGQLRGRLAIITKDYQRAVVANGIIQTKYRQLRQRHKTHLQSLQKKRIAATQSDGSQDQAVLEEGLRKISDTHIPSSSTPLLNTAPNSISPLNIQLEDIQSCARHGSPSLDRRFYPETSVESGNATAGDSYNQPSSAGQDSAAETSDESSTTHSKLATSLKNAPDKALIKDANSVIKSEDSDSDLPIVVSERSLKRKRSPFVNKVTSGEIREAKVPQSNEPIRIKSDPELSSPITSIIHPGISNLQDSIDLDAIEDRHLTPRKRRGFFSEVQSPSSESMLQSAIEHDTTLVDNWSDSGNIEDFHYRIKSWQENQEEMLSERDEAFYRKKGEEYAAKLMENDLRNASGLRVRVGSDRNLPLWLQRSKYAGLARQYSHNKKTHERRARQIDTLQNMWKTDPDKPSKLRRTNTSSPTEHLQVQSQEKDEFTNLIINNEFNQSTPSSRVKSWPSKASFRGSSALKPKNPNVVLLRTKKFSTDQMQNVSVDHGASKISFLAEDGEIFGNANKSRGSSGKSENAIGSSRAPDLFNRLDVLLSEQSSPKTSLTPGKTEKFPNSPATITTLPNTPLPQMNNKGPHPSNSISRHLSKESIANGKIENSSMQKSAKRKRSPSKLAIANEPDDVLPEHEALRTRPIRTLHPEDFKLNPSRNQGYDHAFVEVVRNRDQRKCMPGCTRPGCCGDALRKAVEIGGYPAPRKSGLVNPAPEDEAQQDLHLLQEYLGDDSARLEGMPADERRELLLRAKTEKFANQHGKHRHAYQRGSTPPGFWDTDMPTTQQAQEYRQAAMVMEQQKVQDMYREAMRPNGRYKFRDE